MNNSIAKLSSKLTGYASIFSLTDWQELDYIVANILACTPEIFESSHYGDSRNENVDLRVARFIVRKNGYSKIVNKSQCLAILNIFTRSNFIKTVEQQTQLNNLTILRMQLNAMESGSFVSVHTDIESDPAYEITALIRTTSFYGGGELVVRGDKPQTIKQPNHSIFLMDPCIEHEVKKVTNGCRNSLVVLLGKATGCDIINQTHPATAK